MKDILDKELVIKIDGSIVSTLDDFETTANIVLDKIKTDPVTDEEFVVAKSNVKDCKLVEDMVHNARRNALAEADEIFSVISKTEKIQELFRQKRLIITNNVKTEELARKERIIYSGNKRIKDFLGTTKIKNLYFFDYHLVAASIKGKSSLTKMEEAIDEVVFDVTEEIQLAEQRYTSNQRKISESQEEYPGIYPDIDKLSMEDELLVDSTIENRVAKYKLSLIEKKEKELAEKKRLEDQKTIIKEEAVKTHQAIMDIPPPPPPINQPSSRITTQNDIISTLIDDYSIDNVTASRIVKDIVEGQFSRLQIVY